MHRADFLKARKIVFKAAPDVFAQRFLKTPNVFFCVFSKGEKLEELPALTANCFIVNYS